MVDEALIGFVDELQKISSVGGRAVATAMSRGAKAERLQRQVAYFFSSKAGPDKWDKFMKLIDDSQFANMLSNSPLADQKTVEHVIGMHQLSKGETVGKIFSSNLNGQSYEIRKTPKGLACTCPDWRFNGSINPGYECKHIKAYKAGEVRA